MVHEGVVSESHKSINWSEAEHATLLEAMDYRSADREMVGEATLVPSDKA
jgi:hypothetical protein